MKKEEKSKAGRPVRIGLTLSLILILSAAVASCTNKRSAIPAPPPPPPPTESASTGGQVYDSVDVMPEYSGGNAALVKYIADNTRYPEEARKNKIQGKVLVNFVVEKDGSVDNVKIVNGVDSLIDAEAMRVVSSLPNFEKPGIKDGKNVAVNFMIPINFKLDSAK